jgi:multicomponent Na+:H+ antiporter subunit G
VSLLAGVLLLLGAVFMTLGAVGLVRLPDVYMRMSASSKAATLGASLALLGAAAHFGTAAVAGKAVVIVAFLFLTAPVAAHAIGRAGYRRGSPLWKGTIADELAGSRAVSDEDRPTGGTQGGGGSGWTR